MNDEHTDVLIINKTCETQMSDDEQAGIDPERKSSMGAEILWKYLLYP